MKQQNAYPLRLDPTLQIKIKWLAKQNDRSYRAQIENILKKYVNEYEHVHGVIDISNIENQ